MLRDTGMGIMQGTRNEVHNLDHTSQADILPYVAPSAGLRVFVDGPFFKGDEVPNYRKPPWSLLIGH